MPYWALFAGTSLLRIPNALIVAESLSDSIADGRHDDRDGRSGSSGGLHRLGTTDDDDIDTVPHQLSNRCVKPVESSLHVLVQDHHIRSFAIAEVAKPLPQRFHVGRSGKDADSVQLPRLLRLGDKRYNVDRQGDKQDEDGPGHCGAHDAHAPPIWAATAEPFTLHHSAVRRTPR